jgi:hypothetical protein
MKTFHENQLNFSVYSVLLDVRKRIGLLAKNVCSFKLFYQRGSKWEMVYVDPLIFLKNCCLDLLPTRGTKLKSRFVFFFLFVFTSLRVCVFSDILHFQIDVFYLFILFL